MEQRKSLLASEATPHILTPGSEDDIEEIVRHRILFKQSTVRASAPRRFRPPVQRRIATEETSDKLHQMLEISTNNKRASMDGSDTSCSSAATIATSATSSRSDPMSASSGSVDEQEEDMAGVDWDEREFEQDDEDLIIPKLEPMDDADMIGLSPRSLSPTSDTKESMDADTPTNSPTPEAPAQVKRPRGRPRKHPKPTPESLSKVNKGRSKTGCITCRKRKKKCDETKPGCLNCEKNSVVCEGYPEKTIWRSGKEKNEEAHLRRASSITLNIQLPFLIHGLETEGDRIFLHHYVSRLSVIFTLEGSNDSAFRNIMLPLAQQHSGLMHSILALSSKHLDYSSPYGLQVLREHPSVKIKELEERSQFHEEEAFKQLTSPQLGAKIEAPIYGQMLCLVLQTLSDPTPQGLHRPHLAAYQRLIQAQPPAPNDEVMKFFHEFFQYHIGADQIIHLPQSDVLVSTIDDWNLPNTVFQSSAVRMLGVFDNLFLYMSKITNIRNKIRQNIDLKVEPIVDYHLMYAAAEIDAGIREWTPVWPPGDARETAGLLYKQMMWIYLWRTIYPPQTTNWALHPSITIAVSGGIELLSHIAPKDPSQTLLLAPAFVIGCAAFEMEQREPIRKAISVIKSYMEYKNTDTALKVLEEVWRLMDARDERSWDWQSIAHRMGMDFLAT